RRRVPPPEDPLAGPRHRDRQQSRPALLFPLRHAGARAPLFDGRQAVKTLLRIDVSPRGSDSHSRRFADILVPHLLQSRRGWQTMHRDLADGPASAIDEPYVRAMLTHFTPEQSADAPELAHSERLVGELDCADALVIASPVHNYTVPASLKAWIDQVVRVGR